MLRPVHKERLYQRLNTDWFWAIAFIVLFLLMALWVPPTNWAVPFVGLAFLLAAIPVVLISLRFRFVWIEVPLLAVLLGQAWILVNASEGLPGFELFFPLCVTGSGTYLFMYGMRQWIVRWLEQKGAI